MWSLIILNMQTCDSTVMMHAISLPKCQSSADSHFSIKSDAHRMIEGKKDDQIIMFQSVHPG